MQLKLSNKTKGILVIIGGILMHIISGTVHVWSSLNVYLISYLREFDSTLTLSKGFFLGPFGVFSISLSMSLGGYLERNYGPRQVTILGTSLIILGHLIIYFSKNIFLDYFAMLISGMGVGCNYLIPMRLGFKYFPNNRGFVVGCVQIGLAFTATFLNIIAEIIINPNGVNPTIKDKEDVYFTYDEALGIKRYLKFFFPTIIFLAFCTVILFFPYYPEENNKVKEEKLIPVDNDDNNENDNIENNIIISQKTIENEDNILSVRIALKTWTFWSLFLMGLFSNIYPPLVSNTFRAYGQNNGLSTNLLKYLASGFSGTNSFGRPLWGFIFDIVGFKIILLPGNIILLILSIFFYYTVEYKFLFGFFIVITGFIMGSFYSIFPAYTSKKFGIKLSSEIYGLVFIAFGIANLLGPTFFFIIKRYLKVTSFEPFHYAYLIGGCCQLVSFIICIFAPKIDEKIIS